MNILTAVAATFLATSNLSASQLANPQSKMNSIVPCERLQWDWQHVEKRMAFDHAEQRNAYNVPPMSELLMQEQNDYIRGTLILELMRDNKCPMPTRAPRSTTYSKGADACIKARKSRLADAPSLCDEEKWFADD